MTPICYKGKGIGTLYKNKGGIRAVVPIPGYGLQITDGFDTEEEAKKWVVKQYKYFMEG